MTKITVTLAQAHLDRLARGPAQGLAELIWNAVDADASEVIVEFERNELGGVVAIRVGDNGHGMLPQEAVENFRMLGSSWKQVAERSKGDQRMLHGHNGEGRWSAYGLGNVIRWTSEAEDGNDGCFRTEIIGRRSASNEFEIDSNPIESHASATTVEVTQLTEAAELLNIDKLRERLVVEFALYLAMYPVDIRVDGVAIDPSSLRLREYTDKIDLPDNLGTAKLTIIEWTRGVDREIVLCDEKGFALGDANARFHAPDFHFTVYVNWAGFRERLDRLDVGDLDPEIGPVLAAARAAARRYFRQRSDERERETIARWKAEGVYPYEREPKEEVEQAEQALFQIVALAAKDAVDVADARAKRFSLRLLREAIERDPGSLQQIIEEVLELPETERRDLASILERTKLSNLISAVRQVTDRLDFLKGLEVLVFEPDVRKRLKERAELHRILASETWIFGEEYALTADDESLTTVLKRHIGMLGRTEPAPEPVKRLDDTGAIVDLMLSRVVERRDQRREHLVVELKAPRVSIGPKEIQQVKSYAYAVAEDPRFASTNTRWEFWVVSTSVTRDGDRERRQRDRPFGLVDAPDDAPIKVWVRTWGEIIEDCEHRMKFFQAALKVQASRDEGIEYLRSRHAEYVQAVLDDSRPEAPEAA